jgi:uncharacterized protein YrrD
MMETWKRAQSLSVATLQEGALIGKLEDFQFDLDTHRIFGWRLKGQGMFAKAGGVAAADFVRIGRDLAFVRSESAVEFAGGKATAVEGRAWASQYKGTRAITRRGKDLGEVKDFVVADDGRSVTGILLEEGVLLPLEGRVNTGPSAVIAEEESVAVKVGDDDEKTDWWTRVRGSFQRVDPKADEGEKAEKTDKLDKNDKIDKGDKGEGA